MSLYWKTRTLISGDYREIERNCIELRNKKVISKYKGKEDIYCVIRLFSDEGGLFCIFHKALAGIKYSIDNGFIPVIDMQTKENIFTSSKARKTVNIWEKFFEQPGGISFDKVKKLPNKVIIENPVMFDLNFTDIYDENSYASKYWRKLTKKYIKLSKEVHDLFIYHSNIFFDGSKTLGVLARGTDYNRKTAMGHPIQPTMEELIAKIRNVVDKDSNYRIFLATEDQRILDNLRQEFGESIYTIPQKRYSEEVTTKLGHRGDYVNYALELNQAYLAAIYMLSKCDSLVAGRTTGMLGAYLFSDDFEYVHVFNKGRYGIDDEETLDITKL